MSVGRKTWLNCSSTAAMSGQAHIIFFLLLLFITANSAYADNFDDHFALVFIDEIYESKYGSVLLNRKLLAKAIARIEKAGARALS